VPVKQNRDLLVCDPALDISGTSYHLRTITLDPDLLLMCFPDHTEGDEYKVTREWRFRYRDQVFTVYDWKSTAHYTESYAAYHEFWSRPKVTLHVGSRTPAMEDDFVDALESALLRRAGHAV
jgi:hypothetical protein